ncbi:MAG TPA: signal peptidase II [Planctomycetota bacterium]|nr:signal peptidase II [Planctomycetota bacterium]
MPSPEDLAAIQAIRDPLGYYAGWKAIFDIRRDATFWVWSLALAMGDLVSKRIVFDRLPTIQQGAMVRSGGEIAVIPDFFYIHTTCNYGAAFSLATGKVPLLTIISIVVLLALIGWRHVPALFQKLFGPIRDWPRFAQWGICLVFAGALGNLYDRLLFGYVRDFLDFRGVIIPFRGEQFPIFNVADSYLTVGIIMFLIVAWFFAPKFEGDTPPPQQPEDSKPA